MPVRTVDPRGPAGPRPAPPMARLPGGGTRPGHRNGHDNVARNDSTIPRHPRRDHRSRRGRHRRRGRRLPAPAAWIERATDGDLLRSHLALSPQVILEQRSLAGHEGWTTVLRMIRRQGGPGATLQLDEWGQALLAGCRARCRWNSYRSTRRRTWPFRGSARGRGAAIGTGGRHPGLLEPAAVRASWPLSRAVDDPPSRETPASRHAASALRTSTRRPNTDSTDNTEPNDNAEPIDTTDATELIDSSDPEEPMDRMDPSNRSTGSSRSNRST